MPCELAVIVLVPTALACGTPLGAIVATAWFEEPQVSPGSADAGVPSVSVPLAVNGTSVPAPVVGFAGAIDTLASPGGPTVRTALSLNAPSVPVMLLVPWPTECARPPESNSPAPTVAIA